MKTKLPLFLTICFFSLVFIIFLSSIYKKQPTNFNYTFRIDNTPASLLIVNLGNVETYDGNTNPRQRLDLYLNNKYSQTIYEFTPDLARSYIRFGRFSSSPDGKYLCAEFIMNALPFFCFNLENNSIVNLPNLWTDINNIHWSQDNQLLAISSSINVVEGFGNAALFVSDLNNRSIINLIYEIPERDHVFCNVYIKDLSILPTNIVSFSVSQNACTNSKQKDYVYDPKTKRLNLKK